MEHDESEMSAQYPAGEEAMLEESSTLDAFIKVGVWLSGLQSWTVGTWRVASASHSFLHPPNKCRQKMALIAFLLKSID